MGYASRANKARRLAKLHDGELRYREGILTKIKPHETAPRHVIGGRLAVMLAVASMAVAPAAPPPIPRLRVKR